MLWYRVPQIDLKTISVMLCGPTVGVVFFTQVLVNIYIYRYVYIYVVLLRNGVRS